MKKIEITINFPDDIQSDILHQIGTKGFGITTLGDQPSGEPAPSSCIEIPEGLAKMLRSQANVVNNSVRALNAHSKGRIQSRVYPARDVDDLLYRVETLLEILEKSLCPRIEQSIYDKM